MRKSQSSLIQYIFITLMSIVAIFFLINVFSSFFEDPYNSKIRDIHMNSIYTFIKDSDEIYTRKNLNKECYFMLNLHSILDTQKDENILRGFVIKNDGIYKYDYNREDLKSREYENSYKSFDVNIKKDETSKNILNWFVSNSIELIDTTYLKFTPRDGRYLITAFKDNSQINLLEESNEKANEELNERTKNDFDFSSPDDIMFVGETTKIKEDFDLNFDNFYLAYNPKNKNLFVSQNELTNFLLNENHCTRNELIFDVKTEIAKKINPLFDNYVSARYEKFTCNMKIYEESYMGEIIIEDFNQRRECEEFENKENDIKRQIDFIINDEKSSEDIVTFKDKFYRNLEDFEKLNFEVLDEMKSIKSKCGKITNEVETKGVENIENYWETTCSSLESMEIVLNTLDPNSKAYLEFKTRYEINKKGCEYENLRESLIPSLNENDKVSCSLEKLESFENFYLSDFSFQNKNYENHREEFFKYLNNTKYEYYLCSNSNSQGCNLLNNQFEFYDKYVSPSANDYENNLVNIDILLQILREYYIEEVEE